MAKIDPHFHKFKIKDVLQVIIGGSVLTVPVGFTEETWKLGEVLPSFNILLIILISIIFISTFTYSHYHKHLEKKEWGEFSKRVILTYLISFLIVALILMLIQRAPFISDFAIAFKRTAIVAFPSSMSATIADTIR